MSPISRLKSIKAFKQTGRAYSVELTSNLSNQFGITASTVRFRHKKVQEKTKLTVRGEAGHGCSEFSPSERIIPKEFV